MISAVFCFCARRPDLVRSRTRRAIADKLRERIENPIARVFNSVFRRWGAYEAAVSDGFDGRNRDGGAWDGPEIEEVRGIVRGKQPKWKAVWL